MNIVLFEPEELAATLSRSDPRVQHVERVLQRAPGEAFDAGIINGDRGRAALDPLDSDWTRIRFTATLTPPPLPPITLIVGLPRPQTARDVLRDATTLGVGTLRFVHCERSTASYAQATLWQPAELRRQLILGASQAFDTRLPRVVVGEPLSEALQHAPHPVLALDNFEAHARLGRGRDPGPLTLAIGPERGWGPLDRAALRAANAELVHLGSRPLRVEMAVVAALAIIGG